MFLSCFSNFEKVSYELERTSTLQTKAQNNLEKTQEDVARLQVDMEKLNEKHNKDQMELRKMTSDVENYKKDNAGELDYVLPPYGNK